VTSVRQKRNVKTCSINVDFSFNGVICDLLSVCMCVCVCVCVFMYIGHNRIYWTIS